MRRQLHAEFLKLRSVRTTWLFLAVTAAVVALAVIAQAVTASGGDDLPPLSDPETQLMLFQSASGLAPVIAVLLGTLGLATEVRHHTLASTFLAEPRRTRVLAAKSVATFTLGAVLGLVAAATAVTGSWLVLLATSNDVVADTDRVLASVAGTMFAAALAALLGLGIGGIVRNQAAAIGAALIVMLAVEPLLGAFVPSFAAWLPSAIASRIAGAAPQADPGLVASAGLYGAYVAAALGAAAVVVRRADV
ncbi:MAG TPA: ABC transporter permease [Nitriliruptoraceae bacterium]|nr:ABC transporter permease [Nitriliruptoraceae bacterium]